MKTNRTFDKVEYFGLLIVAFAVGVLSASYRSSAVTPPKTDAVKITAPAAAGRVFNVTAARIDPPMTWDNGTLSLTLVSDELLCSGFGAKQ